MKKRTMYKAVIAASISMVTLSYLSKSLAGVTRYNDNIDQLELAQESEDQDLYDEVAMVKEEKRLTRELTNEAKSLDHKVSRMNVQRESANKQRERLKIVRLDAQKKRDIVFTKATAAERQRDQEIKKVQTLRDQVAKLEESSQASKDKTEKARDDLKEMSSEERSLMQRKSEAKRQIVANANQLKKLQGKKQIRRMTLKQLTHEVSKLERKAKIAHD